MWSEILTMLVNLPAEHRAQVAGYKAKHQCLREGQCYSYRDPKDGIWVIREKEPATASSQEDSKCLSPSQASNNLECENKKSEPKKNQK